MSEQNNGGAAFPSHFNTAIRDGMGGMSLRDYFAAKAPAPPKWWMESYKHAINTDLDTFAQHLAQWNYSYADAMLKERQK